ncbi:putative transposase [Saccharothrix tamanrassetensis]|uniref:Putative transposase n=2 Tax=Saccharothrix tamanrassetensis TaxID=1051531 RepID=A0A841CL54_9PSEU|nr:putative transposase [Saccharothrix tamanrassetensis]
MLAADWLEQGRRPPGIARELRVSEVSVYRWRRILRTEGRRGLVSRGPSGPDCLLSQGEVDRLGRALDAGPETWGWDEDRRWTLARVAELIRRLSGHEYTLRGVSKLLHRMGYSPQVPARRADRRDERAIADWRQESWTRVKG